MNTPAKGGASRVCEGRVKSNVRGGGEGRGGFAWPANNEWVKGRWVSEGVDPVTWLPLREPRAAAGKANLLSTYWSNYLLLPQIYFAY